MAVVGRAARAVSRDGIGIAYWTSGEGPPLVLVHGTTADHTRWRPLLPHLERHATVHAVDRRGRGASGDARDYHVEREFEDVAAVVDAVPPDVERRMDELLAAGQRDTALETFFREVAQMPEEELGAIGRLPAWRARVAAADTLTREVRAVVDGGFDAARAAQVTAPTLMLLGGDSPQVVVEETGMVAAALVDVRVQILEGQQHIAIDLDPGTVARRVLAFLRDR